MKFYLFFTENGTMKFKSFPEKLQLEMWAGDFLFRHKDNRDDNCIDSIVEGNVEYLSSDFTEVV
jgi:hypothetical protein